MIFCSDRVFFRSLVSVCVLIDRPTRYCHFHSDLRRSELYAKLSRQQPPRMQVRVVVDLVADPLRSYSSSFQMIISACEIFVFCDFWSTLTS